MAFTFVGGDAHIAPPGETLERLEKTDTSIPLGHGPMWASAPTKKIFLVGQEREHGATWLRCGQDFCLKLNGEIFAQTENITRFSLRE